MIRSAASFSVYEPFSTIRSNNSPPVTLPSASYSQFDEERFTNLKFSHCKIADCQFVEDIPCAIDTVDDGSGDDDEERKKEKDTFCEFTVDDNCI